MVCGFMIIRHDLLCLPIWTLATVRQYGATGFTSCYRKNPIGVAENRRGFSLDQILSCIVVLLSIA